MNSLRYYQYALIMPHHNLYQLYHMLLQKEIVCWKLKNHSILFDWPIQGRYTYSYRSSIGDCISFHGPIFHSRYSGRINAKKPLKERGKWNNVLSKGKFMSHNWLLLCLLDGSSQITRGGGGLCD